MKLNEITLRDATQTQISTTRSVTRLTNMTTDYSIAICEIFNKNIHGYSEESTQDMENRLLASYTFTNDEFMDKREWLPILANMRMAYSQYSGGMKSHSSIRNYKQIVENPDYYKLDIVKIEELPGGETSAVIKTGGIKQIQKRWKKHLKHKRLVIQKRYRPENLRYREINGRWPADCCF